MGRDGAHAPQKGGEGKEFWGRSPAEAGGSLRTLQLAALRTKAAGCVRCQAPQRRGSPSLADSSGGRSKGCYNLGMADGPAAGRGTRIGARSAAAAGSGTTSSTCSSLPHALSSRVQNPEDPKIESQEWQTARIRDSERQRQKQGQIAVQLHPLQEPRPPPCSPCSHPTLLWLLPPSQ